MPDIQHSNLTGAELHEPKGISGASSNQTYVANGAGSGSWTEPEPKGASGASLGDVYVSNGAGSGTWQQQGDYAQIYTTLADAATLGGIGTTAITFPFQNNGISNASVADQANNRITIDVAGAWRVTFTASTSTVAAGDAGLYRWRLAVNGTPGVFGVRRQLSGTSDSAVVAFDTMLTLAANDILTIQVDSDEAANTDDINIEYAMLNAQLIQAS